MTLHLKSRGYPFRPRLLFSSFIVVGVGSPNCVLFQERTWWISLGGNLERVQRGDAGSDVLLRFTELFLFSLPLYGRFSIL